jgi:uncharacterized protein YgiM (DUF1202 family)
MKFQATLAAILLPLVALAAPAAEAAAGVAQSIPVAKAQSARRATGLDELSKRSSVPCEIVNSDSAQVNCRSGPGTQFTVVGYVTTGDTYTFHCYESGSCYEDNWCVCPAFHTTAFSFPNYDLAPGTRFR